jgi:hypothetical protein
VDTSAGRPDMCWRELCSDSYRKRLFLIARRKKATHQ